MNYDVDHERFANKQKSMARAYEVENRDARMERKGYARVQRQQEASCFNCRHKNKCMEFRAKRSGGSKGAVSFGGDETFMCDRFVPAPSGSKAMSRREIKSLLKNVRRGH
jgi:hypothetical protein